MNLKLYYSLAKETFQEFSDDNAAVYAASLSYFTLFSLAPLLLIAISVAGFFFGHEAAQQEVAAQIQGLMGNEGAQAVQALLQNTQKNADSAIVATVVGTVTLIFGASGVFGQLQTALNSIWEVKSKPGLGVVGFLKARLLSFSIVLIIGMLLLLSLILTAFISGAGDLLARISPLLAVFTQVINLVVSFLLSTFLFAALYKVLPDVKVPWKNVWVGACTTSLLFTLGKFLIGLYLGKSGMSSAYGAAGSL